tara:strand:+ start:158 stop:1570 length:1413 start_codon:yes stop_codon:yes gene_type:complete
MQSNLESKSINHSVSPKEATSVASLKSEVKKMIPEYAPKQIVEYIPCDNPENEKYFVYEWYNITKDKYYVGYHKTEDGTPFDGYWHSSKDREFADDFSTCKWRYTIKDWGNQSLMLGLENTLLTNAKAKDNPKYYNKTNGIPQEFNLPDLDTVYEIADQVLDTGCWDEISPVLASKEDLTGLVEYQPRHDSLDAEHEQYLKNKIDDSNGDYAKKELLLLVLVDRNWEGKVCNLQINGRHSKNAFFKSKTGTKIRVLYVPKKKHIIFDDEEVRQLSMAMNPVVEKKTKETDIEDIIKSVYNLRVQGVSSKSRTVQKILDRYHLTSSQRRKVLKGVKEMLSENTSQVNQLWIMWNAGQEEQDLKDRLEKENRQPGIYCKAFNTKMNDFWKSLHMIRELNEENPGTIKVFKCLFWHPSAQVENNWFSKDMLKNKNRLNYYLNRNGKDKDGVEVIFEYLPTTKSSTIDNGEEVN